MKNNAIEDFEKQCAEWDETIKTGENIPHFPEKTELLFRKISDKEAEQLNTKYPDDDESLTKEQIEELLKTGHFKEWTLISYDGWSSK